MAAEGEHGEGDEGVGGLESERDAGEEADLGVHRFDASVGEAVFIEARIEARCLTMLRCSFTNAGIRQRRAQDTHLSSASPA